MRDDDTANRQLIDGAVTDITACKHRDAESAWLAQFPGANPNPVLRIDRDGILLYCNKASGPLLETWGCRKRDACRPAGAKSCSMRSTPTASSGPNAVETTFPRVAVSTSFVGLVLRAIRSDIPANAGGSTWSNRVRIPAAQSGSSRQPLVAGF